MWEYELYHHGILGQRWGIRRFQNPDGTLTERGRQRLQKKDIKWAKRNYNKIYKKASNAVRKPMREFERNELQKSGLKGAYARNAYNKKLAEMMSMSVKDLRSPGGQVIQFVAKRGELGAHMVLASPNYDLNEFRNGVYGSGRIAYRQKHVDMA